MRDPISAAGSYKRKRRADDENAVPFPELPKRPKRKRKTVSSLVSPGGVPPVLMPIHDNDHGGDSQAGKTVPSDW